MKHDRDPLPALPRREFLQIVAGAVAGTALTQGAEPTPSVQARPASKMIAIQVGAVSFFDEGVEAVLDTVQEKGAVNTLALTTFTYGRGLAGRQVPGQPFPDHGSQESDQKTFHGGNYATPHREFYQNTILKETRAPDHGDRDIIAAILPSVKKRVGSSRVDLQACKLEYSIVSPK